MKNYYYILGVERNATLEEIKKAYKKLALKFHPDQNNGDKFFEERFKEIAEAYEILSNQERRNQYDLVWLMHNAQNASSNRTNSSSQATEEEKRKREAFQQEKAQFEREKRAYEEQKRKEKSTTEEQKRREYAQQNTSSQKQNSTNTQRNKKNISSANRKKYLKLLFIGLLGIAITYFFINIYHDLKNHDIEDLAYVEGGTFMMGNYNGSEKAIHSVKLSSYYIGKYEVTQQQWRDIMGSNPSSFSNCNNCPVEQVSWDDIQYFLQKLNQKTGKEYRLPTEAEWEYAAKGGKRSNGYEYSGSDNLDAVAWYDGNSRGKTHYVGLKKANELGIFDMSGNVWEWCVDSSSTDRALRGGSWYYYANSSRISFKYSFHRSGRITDFGFRLCRSE
jgi:formylglycine-generating enzyme required for sulfatase activity